MAKEVNRSQLEETLRYRSDEGELRKKIASVAGGGQTVNLSNFLVSAGLEPTLWAFRVLPESQDADIRILACDIVQNLLEQEKNRNRFITTDEYPFELLRKARLYASGFLDQQEILKINSKQAYTEAMRMRNERWSRLDPSMFGASLTKAAVETLRPDARLGAYFAIVSAHSRITTPQVNDEEKQVKIGMLKTFID